MIVVRMERVNCPASNCGKSVAIRYAAGTDATEGRSVKHKKPGGEPCMSGYFTWSLSGGWILAFWRG